MNFELSIESDKQLGQHEYSIKESKGMKFFFFIGGLAMGIGLPYSYFILGINWVSGIFQKELSFASILTLSASALFLSIYSLFSIRKKSKVEICKYGLSLNDQQILYKDINSIKIKRGFFISIIIQTAGNQFVYKASKFSHKDQEALDQVIQFIRSI